MPGLQQANGASRATRARYPNAGNLEVAVSIIHKDIETSQFPAGWMMGTESWLPPIQYPPATTITVQSPQRDDTIEFQQYT